eukprot:gene4399-4655_t
MWICARSPLGSSNRVRYLVWVSMALGTVRSSPSHLTPEPNCGRNHASPDSLRDPSGHVRPAGGQSLRDTVHAAHPHPEEKRDSER